MLTMLNMIGGDSMGGLFGGGSSKTVPLPPTPSLVPEATSVSRAEVSDSASIIAP